MELDLTKTINIIEGQDINLWIQVFLLVVLFFYSIFALLMNRQISILNKAIQTTRARQLNKLALTQLIAGLFLLIIVILMVIF